MKRYVVVLALYFVAVTSSLGAAQLLKKFSTAHLYISQTADTATISLSRIDKDQLEKVIEIALRDDNIRKKLTRNPGDPAERLFNYVLPAEWFVPDIPMQDARAIGEHYTPEHYDSDRYKLLLMRALLRRDAAGAEEENILVNTVKIAPQLEVEVSLKEQRVIRIDNPPATVIWGDIPTPLF